MIEMFLGTLLLADQKDNLEGKEWARALCAIND